jgi:hypothetical protein
MWMFVWFAGTPVLVLLAALGLERLQRVTIDALQPVGGPPQRDRRAPTSLSCTPSGTGAAAPS